MPEVLRLRSSGTISWLECARLARFPQLVHAFGSRFSSSFSQEKLLPKSLVISDQQEKNRKFLSTLGIAEWSIASLQQIHSDKVFQVKHSSQKQLWVRPTTPEANRWQPLDNLVQGDALITQETELLLSVETADCIPVALFVPNIPTVAIIHSGWLGTLQRIVEKTAYKMHSEFRIKPKEIVAVIGPCIQKCCYEIGEEVFEAYHNKFSYAQDLFFLPGKPHTSQKPHLNISRAAQQQLLIAGLSPSKIFRSNFCTQCRNDLFYSHRMDLKSKRRMLSVIGLHRRD